MNVFKNGTRNVIVLSGGGGGCPRMVVGSSRLLQLRDDFGGKLSVSKKSIAKISVL